MLASDSKMVSPGMPEASWFTTESKKMIFIADSPESFGPEFVILYVQILCYPLGSLAGSSRMKHAQYFSNILSNG